MSADNQEHREEISSKVEIEDIKMPFWSMVRFMVKWTIASIPAIIILLLLFAIFNGILPKVFNY